MADVLPQFESSDIAGSTVIYNGAVGTTFVAVPSVADKDIAEVIISCKSDQANNKRLLVNYDGGANVHTLTTGEWIALEPRGGIKQIRVKGNIATVDYEIEVNFEP